VKIRLADESDVPVLPGLFRRSVERIGPERYTAEQIRAWAVGPDDAERFRQFILGVTTFVAEDRRRIVGFCGLAADGHIASLYVDGGEGRKGIGSILMDAAIEEARACGIPRLYTEASEFSKPLFEKFGFKTTEIEHVTHNGVEFERYRMQLVLCCNQFFD
jgi:putative acetyltransferase